MDILLGESKVLEYKSTFTKNILKTVSAFANFHAFTISEKGKNKMSLENLVTPVNMTKRRLPS